MVQASVREIGRATSLGRKCMHGLYRCRLAVAQSGMHALKSAASEETALAIRRYIIKSNFCSVYPHSTVHSPEAKSASLLGKPAEEGLALIPAPALDDGAVLAVTVVDAPPVTVPESV